jgi:hypothetical protein
MKVKSHLKAGVRIIAPAEPSAGDEFSPWGRVSETDRRRTSKRKGSVASFLWDVFGV